MPTSKPILIVGAGLAGCLMAIEVARLGYRAVIFEKRPGNGNEPASRRSINLALASSTLRLLHESAGIAAELAKIATPLGGRVLHPLAGEAIFQPYAATVKQSSLLNPPAGAVSVSRSDLNALLRQVAARNSKIEFRCGQRVFECNPEKAELCVEDGCTKNSRVAGEAIIAADGAGSAVRRQLIRDCGIRENRTTLKHAYKELTFTPGCKPRRPALHIWPRRGFLMMALPHRDGTFRGAIFLPRRGPNGFSALESARASKRFFNKHFPDVARDVDHLVEQFAKNPVSSLVSLRCDPWHAGRTVLIGDACHTLYPFTGLGANLALEDCVHLRRNMEQFAPDWTRVLSAFTESRRPMVDYLCEAARAISPLVLSALPQEGVLARI